MMALVVFEASKSDGTKYRMEFTLGVVPWVWLLKVLWPKG